MKEYWEEVLRGLIPPVGVTIAIIQALFVISLFLAFFAFLYFFGDKFGKVVAHLIQGKSRRNV
jgi:hypothetical protein